MAELKLSDLLLTPDGAKVLINQSNLELLRKFTKTPAECFVPDDIILSDGARLVRDGGPHYSYHIIHPKIVDDGQRTTFDTGAVREIIEGKGRYDLLPYLPLLRMAQHYENALKKYPERNWEAGLPLKSYLDSAMRHMTKLIEGFDDEDHAAAVMWNVAAFIATVDWIKAGKLPLKLADGLRPNNRNQFIGGSDES